MIYELKFLPAALNEWKKLTPPIREQFRKKLAERLVNPHVPSARLSGYDSVYKIKLRAAGYRLAYEVMNDEFVVLVLVVGKRDKEAIYRKLNKASNERIQRTLVNLHC